MSKALNINKGEENICLTDQGGRIKLIDEYPFWKRSARSCEHRLIRFEANDNGKRFWKSGTKMVEKQRQVKFMHRS